VIAVVLFHFNPTWMPGGFAGVDVFFVISGFLMTGIIFRGIEQEKFSILKFYVARANRIIPALALLCLVLLVFGWFYLTPLDYKVLGKHVVSSLGFISNIIYWQESGYFDASSHGKWLLHSWSLSVEWQFYILYPIALVVMKRFTSINVMKYMVLIGAVLGFVFCVIATYKLPNAAYYLLPTRAWEMMVGGVACLFPIALQQKHKIKLEVVGILLIFCSYVFISKDNLWPGYLALFPVLGAFLLIQAERNDSLITSNFIFQKLGEWSYSIYLWHWPFVVAIYYFSLSERWAYIGIVVSILLGFLSHKYVEKLKFKNSFTNLAEYIRCKPIYMTVLLGGLGIFTYSTQGIYSKAFFNTDLIKISSLIQESPYRDRCHTGGLVAMKPSDACTYFSDNVTWATIGDSHTVEIAYALAEKSRKKNEGLMQFSFSGCAPSYKKSDNFARCANWTNEAVNEIVKDKQIKNVLINYRYSLWLSGNSVNREAYLSSIDDLVTMLANNKEHVYIFKPIPKLDSKINFLIRNNHLKNEDLNNIKGRKYSDYSDLNNYVLNYFDNANYPENVIIIDTKNVFCGEENCFATKNGVPLYFDDNHPSVKGAELLVKKININE
jgi:peptidoglycan/LPS O-acetylase OafA/YrhL